MCEVVVRDNNLGNFDDGSAYTKVQSLKHSLIIERSCSLASEFPRKTYVNLKMKTRFVLSKCL